eukprot:CAMPEP_0202816606 /NCGR_PEP_ID=MMETSP1389-20130828/7052_1 /ASSEMBLY_ACC=CAM_ASM_000865 /TAXON_ID=302021 /ORGANISM="Rhodomonas sp., Strain CCMP768" /LENGTH=98 /DNA_ID=CAMNT_0049488673 /DNA_START=11 /DNA_END=304 /DNA_ORIENTATION=-
MTTVQFSMASVFRRQTSTVVQRSANVSPLSLSTSLQRRRFVQSVNLGAEERRQLLHSFGVISSVVLAFELEPQQLFRCQHRQGANQDWRRRVVFIRSF